MKDALSSAVVSYTSIAFKNTNRLTCVLLLTSQPRPNSQPQLSSTLGVTAAETCYRLRSCNSRDITQRIYQRRNITLTSIKMNKNKIINFNYFRFPHLGHPAKHPTRMSRHRPVLTMVSYSRRLLTCASVLLLFLSVLLHICHFLLP